MRGESGVGPEEDQIARLQLVALDLAADPELLAGAPRQVDIDTPKDLLHEG